MPPTEAEELAGELAWMREPDRWPNSFWLPLKRSARPGAGMLYQPSLAEPCPPPAPFVYLGTAWDSTPLAKRERLEYPDLAAVLADGWRVD